MKYEVWTVWFIWKLFPFTWYCIWSKTWKNINIYRFFFPLEVQVTRKGNMQQRRVLRTVSSQTWKRHLFSESFLPSWPLPCMMVKSKKLTRLRVKFARATWTKLSRSKSTYYFTIFLRPFLHAKLWVINHNLYMNFFFLLITFCYIIIMKKFYEKFCRPRIFCKKILERFLLINKIGLYFGSYLGGLVFSTSTTSFLTPSRTRRGWVCEIWDHSLLDSNASHGKNDVTDGGERISKSWSSSFSCSLPFYFSSFYELYYCSGSGILHSLFFFFSWVINRLLLKIWIAGKTLWFLEFNDIYIFLIGSGGYSEITTIGNDIGERLF